MFEAMKTDQYCRAVPEDDLVRPLAYLAAITQWKVPLSSLLHCFSMTQVPKCSMLVVAMLMKGSNSFLKQTPSRTVVDK